MLKKNYKLTDKLSTNDLVAKYLHHINLYHIKYKTDERKYKKENK
tara:strand:- start:876 stop:1010 length:135 start_codon:yes stop_codon:yes gene_type:complete